jgi:uncharacterized protein (TIGR02421 family)
MSSPNDASCSPLIVEETNRFDDIADAACERLARNQRVRRNLPGDGRLRIDRQLPFLCLYRAPADAADVGTRELVTTEAAYIFTSADEAYHDGLERLCQRIGAAMVEHFGTYLFVELWATSDSDSADPGGSLAGPAFEVLTASAESLPSTLKVLTDALSRIEIHGRPAIVQTRSTPDVAPPGLAPLSFAWDEPSVGGCCAVGVAIRPIYRAAADGPIFPLILQRLRWQLAAALRQTIAQFTGLKSGGDAVHYQSLGPSSMVKAARIADQQLCETAESFDFLLQVTPTNAEQAWADFTDGGLGSSPALHYRPLPYHPSLLKRRLFDIEIERIEDPTLAHLFWEKQIEVDRQLTALRDIETPQFLDTSRQLYGDADAELVQLAEKILARATADGAGDDIGNEEAVLSLNEFVDRARDEIDHYYQKLNAFNANVEICDSIASGIMVSRDHLLIAGSLRVRAARVEPLLHHEVGTHLLTYFNGRAQPFRQLYAGLAGYDELQEGLAILAEFLCGGLTQSRLRTLAGRVMAVRSLTEGESFVETFERLHQGHGFAPRQAFMTTLRVHRGGGLTKDVIYLRGFRNLLAYLRAGHDLEPLYVGKIGLHHLPYIQELRRRGIIRPPGLLPRFWEDESTRRRLERCRTHLPLDLLENTP